MANNKDMDDNAHGKISITLSLDTLQNVIEGCGETQRAADMCLSAVGSKRKHCVCGDPEECLHHEGDAPLSVSIPASGENKSSVVIRACPSYFNVWRVDQDGTKEKIFAGRHGTVYGLVKAVRREMDEK